MTDFNQLLANVATIREAVAGVVAGLIADGFDDDQAREITASLFRGAYRDDADEQPQQPDIARDTLELLITRGRVVVEFHDGSLYDLRTAIHYPDRRDMCVSTADLRRILEARRIN